MNSRLAIGGLGVAGMAFGAYQALAHLSGQLPSLLLWLAVPVIITDALVSPTVITIAWAGRRLLPRPAWGPAVLGLVGTGALTAAASVVLTRPGAHSDLPSLLDRNYPAGYLLALATLWSGVLLLGMILALRAGPRARTSSRSPASGPAPTPGPDLVGRGAAATGDSTLEEEASTPTSPPKSAT